MGNYFGWEILENEPVSFLSLTGNSFMSIIWQWFLFQGKASKRKHVLDEAYGQQGFLADSRDLVNFQMYLWIAYQINVLNTLKTEFKFVLR